MTQTLVQLAMVLLGSVLGVVLQRKLPAAFLDRAFRLVAFFILAIGLRIFLHYHQPVLVLTGLFLGAVLGMWWNLPDKITKMGNYFLKILLNKKIFFPSPSPFKEGFVVSTLLLAVGSLAILSGFGASPTHVSWSIHLVLTFLTALILAVTLGWGVVFSILPLFILQALMSLSGGPIQSFFSDNIVSDLAGVGGILIALWGMKLSKLTMLEPTDLLPALLVSPLVGWAYYSLLGS